MQIKSIKTKTNGTLRNNIVIIPQYSLVIKLNTKNILYLSD